MNKIRQVFNPYLPEHEYVPDGEPHVFGNRVYLYGSHDRFDGQGYCLNDYVCYSAAVDELRDWRYEGIIYRKDQDIRNQDGSHAMWAPDVVQGPDGRYYLYYCLDVLPQIGVAICDTPAGRYEFHGLVRYDDGVALGDRAGDLIQFDPGVFVDEDGCIYLYSGNGPRTEDMIGKEPKHSQVMKLEMDMVTLKSDPLKLLPSLGEGEESGYEGHEFFEASSIRKINGWYYLVYSSVQLHELCYAISRYPDRDFSYGGTIISHSDIVPGRNEVPCNAWGNNHGGIECIDGNWYVFYHRQTNRTFFSRQGCADRIYFDNDGRISQVEVTSCGLNGEPLKGVGIYPAAIACHVTGKNGAALSRLAVMEDKYPYFCQDGADWSPEMGGAAPRQYVKNCQDGLVLGYKYFNCKKLQEIHVTLRGTAEGRLYIRTRPEGADCGDIVIAPDTGEWTIYQGKVVIPDGIQALYFCYEGTGIFDILEFELLAE